MPRGNCRLARARRIRPISDKRRRQMVERAACMTIVRARSRGLCECRVAGVCTHFAAHGHEPLTRARGGDPTDPDNVLDACPACHRWIHDHDEAATALGLLVHSWEKPQ